MSKTIVFNESRNYKQNLFSVFGFLLQEFPVFTKFLAIIYGPVFIISALLSYFLLSSGYSGTIYSIIFACFVLLNIFLIINFVLSYFQLHIRGTEFSITEFIEEMFETIQKTANLIIISIIAVAFEFFIIFIADGTGINVGNSLFFEIVTVNLFLYLLFNLIIPISVFDNVGSLKMQLSKALNLINGNFVVSILSFLIFCGIAEIFVGFNYFLLNSLYSEYWKESFSRALYDEGYYKVIINIVSLLFYVIVPIFMTTYSVFTYFGIKSEEGEIEKSRKGFHI